ncbi:hypothetical protein X73_00663 [Pasteurella multocida subsp. gallicida X73]|nr:hypothetical protein X73_00663 [Pasteurella multocida subsp. gallicida X73]
MTVACLGILLSTKFFYSALFLIYIKQCFFIFPLALKGNNF